MKKTEVLLLIVTVFALSNAAAQNNDPTPFPPDLQASLSVNSWPVIGPYTEQSGSVSILTAGTPVTGSLNTVGSFTEPLIQEGDGVDFELLVSALAAPEPGPDDVHTWLQADFSLVFRNTSPDTSYAIMISTSLQLFTSTLQIIPPDPPLTHAVVADAGGGIIPNDGALDEYGCTGGGRICSVTARTRF